MLPIRILPRKLLRKSRLLQGMLQRICLDDTSEEKHIIENKGTERAGTGTYDKFYPTEGYFACRRCGNPIYSFQSKFDSGCGWPAFYDGVPGAIAEVPDADGARVEIVCANCGGHLGHVFEGEGFTSTNERHCVNSISIKFVTGTPPSTAEAPVVT